MSIAIPQSLVSWLVGAGLVGIFLALVTVIRAYRQLRRAEYYIIRETARRTVVRAMLMIPVLALLTLSLLLIPRRSSTPTPTASPTIVVLQQSPTPVPPRITLTPTVTAPSTPLPTATEPFIPTSTPQATLPVTLTLPFSGAITPPADARIEFWTLAHGVDENNQPVGATSQFPEGVERVYLFFRYDGLLPNVPLTTVWYQDGEFLRGGTDLWESQLSKGERYVFLGPVDGYAAGEYEVQVWLGDRLQIRAFFTVVKAQG